MEDNSTETWVKTLNSHIIAPDIALYLSIDADTSAERRDARGEAEEIFDKKVFQMKLIEKYEQIEKLFPQDPVRVIDGSRSIEEIATRVWDAVQQMLEG